MMNDEASQSFGWNVWLPEALQVGYRLVCWDCMKNDDPARIPKELENNEGARDEFFLPQSHEYVAIIIVRIDYIS